MDVNPTASATELTAALRRRQISSRELLELYAERIERLDGPVGAVVTLDLERARAAAAAADEATAHGGARGPLHGLPTTIKDAIATEGIRSTGGAVELAEHVPDEDAPAVRALRDAGAVVLGKTNLPRWSGDLQSYNELFGTTSNPHDLTRTPGGSSGGAAAAVAAGFTSFELGTDIGGSVRLPSHFCGVFGLKPSWGVVSQRGYLDHVEGGLLDVDINVLGPIARSADDLDLLLDVLAERPLAPARPTSAPGLRAAVWFDEPSCPVDPACAALLRQAADALAEQGAEVVEEHPPVAFDEQVGVFLGLVGAAMLLSGPPEAQASPTHADWLRLQSARARLQRTWARWFDQHGVDVLLCPVSPTAALPHQQEGSFLDRTIDVGGQVRPYLDNIRWTGLIGVLGLPSAVPPIGRTPAGLPVGVQVVAPHLHDRQAVAVARLLGTYAPPPGFG